MGRMFYPSLNPVLIYNDGISMVIKAGQMSSYGWVVDAERMYEGELGDLFYLDPNPTGSPCVLLLHGLGADGASWEYQLRVLAEAGMRPVAPDLPGFGRSIYRGKGWKLAEVSGEMFRFLESLTAQPAKVVGLSMGGALAVSMGIEAAGRVDQLVLMNTFACLRPKTLSERLYLVRRFLVANLRGVKYQAELVAWRLFPHADQAGLRQLLVEKILQADRNVYRAAMRQLAVFDARRWLGEINMPTLVVTAERDTTVPREIQDVLAQNIPGARQVIVPNSGHAVIVDQWERVNQILLDFLHPG